MKASIYLGQDRSHLLSSFNSILDAWAKSGGGRAAAERAEEILEWMDRLHKSGNKDVKPDTISYVHILFLFNESLGTRPHIRFLMIDSTRLSTPGRVPVIGSHPDVQSKS